ncbi:MAG: aminotransferase class V-fold PLP-dependent enzyme [Phycisphaerae bacterium]|nr:aminotransferase class V-fold PLP-dependent enzyme [Phycisphaerae bacterium]
MPPSSMPAVAPSPAAIRSLYPALTAPTILLENAGGSQVPRFVADAVRHHLLNDCVQLGAGYPASVRATETVERAHRLMDRIIHGEGLGRVVLGASSTALMHVLAQAIGRTIRPGDEIVVCDQGHESNIGAWLSLERLGARIRWWKVDPATGSLQLETLRAVLSERTRLVAFPHVSNLLGEIVDAEGATRLAHEAGAKVFIDGVALAPHRAIDVRAWSADFYAWSTYKVYGPHMGAIFCRFDALDDPVHPLEGPNHFFILRSEVPYKFELGGASHEGCAGLCGLARLLEVLAGEAPAEAEVDAASLAASADRVGFETASRAFAAMTALEAPVQSRLLDRLAAHRRVRLVGPRATSTEARVATVSFLHATRDPREIVAAARAAGIGIRHGHMYAHRLVTAMGIAPDPGVVRVSAVHYNTAEEVDRLMDALDPILA